MPVPALTDMAPASSSKIAVRILSILVFALPAIWPSAARWQPVRYFGFIARSDRAVAGILRVQAGIDVI